VSRPVIATHVKGPELQAYAAELIDAGFTVRVVQAYDVNGQQIPCSWFLYEKDGCCGIVQKELDGYSHSMPVKPSKENGSAILITNAHWDLQVADAVRTARPQNGGPWVRGVFKNDASEARWERYTEVFKTVEAV
jgi:hypothetical protein